MLCRILAGPDWESCARSLFTRTGVQFSIFEGYENTMTFEIYKIERKDDTYQEFVVSGKNLKGKALQLFYNIETCTGHFDC